jgi:Double-GTPase 1
MAVDQQNNNNRILLMGLPESGKTTFLAGLSAFTESSSPEKKMEQYHLSSNSSYLTSIVNRWLDADEQERTKISATKNDKTDAELYLRFISSDEKFTLYIPDFHGEAFENQFLDRQMDEELSNQVKNCQGMLLFIQPEKIKNALLIEDIHAAKAIEKKINQLASGPGNGIDVVISQEKPVADPFDKEHIPTQLVLSDLIEIQLSQIPSGKLHLALVISAWDSVIKLDNTISPFKWLEKNMPLLYQYLICNNEKLNFRVFGVSANGGDVKNLEDKKRLQNFPEPTDRIFVQEEEVKHKNIASPIEWILEQWQSSQ